MRSMANLPGEGGLFKVARNVSKIASSGNIGNYSNQCHSPGRQHYL